jgi:hypothetical protein
MILLILGAIGCFYGLVRCTIGINPIFGRPGFGTAQTAQRTNLSRNGALDYYPAGGVISGLNARDPGNTADSTGQTLRPGLLMGKVSSLGYYANSTLGLTQGALATGGTSITLAGAAYAAELVRRVGTTGNLILTGPPVASGVVRSAVIAYSAVNTTTGVVTITSPSVNEVQTLDFANSPAGTFVLKIVDQNGVVQLTPPITYSATIATLLTNIQTAINTVIPQVSSVNQIVASGTLVTAVALTFSGVNFAGAPQSMIAANPSALTAGTISVTRTTPGVSGAFVTESIVQIDDGSQNILSVIGDGYGYVIPTPVADVSWPLIPVAGTVDVTNIVDWPVDPSLQTWVENQLSNNTGGKWIFSNVFSATAS